MLKSLLYVQVSSTAVDKTIYTLYLRLHGLSSLASYLILAMGPTKSL